MTIPVRAALSIDPERCVGRREPWRVGGSKAKSECLSAILRWCTKLSYARDIELFNEVFR